MKKILVHYPDGLGGRLFSAGVRDNCNDPYIALKKRLQCLGYDLYTSDDHRVEDSEWVLFFDSVSVYGPDLKQRLAQRLVGQKPSFPQRDLYRECINASMSQRMALLLLESPMVMPRNSDPRLHARFPIVFTWRDSLVDGKKFHKIHIPQPCRFPEIAPQSFNKKKLLCNISANKKGRYPSELYSERQKSIRYFERARPADFDLYGVGWDKPSSSFQRIIRQTSTYISYRGTVNHKWDVYPRYRFALCYENVKDESGYITEKIFDCMRADCVPVYWGASNVTDYIPAEAFIDCRQFRSNQELERYLVHITEDEYERYRSAINNFLASDSFRRFLEDAFVKRILDVFGVKPTNQQKI